MSKKELGILYEQVIGYDITKDCPKITEDEILQIMREYDEETGENEFRNLKAYE